MRDKTLIDLLELAAADELGSKLISHLDSLWTVSGDASARLKILTALPSRTAMLYGAYQTTLRLREQRRRNVAGWDEW